MQRDQIIRINQGRILRREVRLVLTVLIFSLMLAVLFQLKEEVAILLIILGTFPLILIWYSFHVIQIDSNSHQISIGYWLTGFQWMKSMPYKKLNRVIIRHSFPIDNFSKFWSAKGRKSLKAFLIYDDHEEIYLLSGDSKSRLIVLVEKFIKKSGESIKIEN